MRTKSTTRLAAAVVAVVGCLAFTAAPAAANPHTGTVAPGSEITLTPNIGGPETHPLGVPPDPANPPPAECNVASPDDWEPSTIDLDINDSVTPHAVTTDFDLEPMAMDFGAFGWCRVVISGTGSGTINPSTGEVSITINVSLTFQDCSSGNPTVCTATATIMLTGMLNPYPIQPGVSVATLAGSGTLSASFSTCDFVFLISLQGASISITLVLDL